MPCARASLRAGLVVGNDRTDAGTIARPLRGGTFSLAYAYPKGMRNTCDLLRKAVAEAFRL